MKWLLDTNVVSETIQARPDAGVMAWMAARAPEQFAISIVTLAELREGAALAPDEAKRAFLRQWIDAAIEPFFGDRTLPLSAAILVDWLGLARRLGARGRPQSAPDLLIAATARRHDLILVTRNSRDFAGTGVTLYNPWSNETQVMDLA